uniref:Uncharacterized protein n=1 Tax=Peronospora matthiolae TaxID=2874970 RepID=A0AAV1TDA8_9STRA
MRCSSKAAESASARLCADAEAETAAIDVSSVAEATQPVSPGDAGARHEDTHVFTEYELGVSYSPDTEDGSVSTTIESKPPAKRGMDDAMRRSIFGSSDESDEPSPKRRRSRSRDSGANSGFGSPREKGLPCLSWGDSCPSCVNNSARAPKEAYLLSSPWWRVRISSEMYEGIDNLKSLYDRAGRTFSGGPSAAKDVPRRTAQPDPVRQSSVGSGSPKYPRTGDSRATGRGNSSDGVEEEGRRSPNNRGEACVPESFFDRVTQGLRGDLEHERYRRLQLADAVLRHRAEFAFALLENERALTSLRDELRVARVDIDRSRDEITALQTLVDAHHREHKALCEMLERKGVLHRKKQRTDGTA